MKFIFTICILLPALLMSGKTSAQNSVPLSGLSAISESDIRNSAIAFVNTTSSPGLEGATINVDNGSRESDQWRSSLGFTAEITLKDHIFNAYWGLGLVGGSLKDKIQITADDGRPVELDITRDILSVRGSFGLVFPINQNFKLRPVLTFAVSDMESESVVDSLFDNNDNLTVQTFQNSAQIASTTGSIDALYWNWFDEYKLELSAHFNVIYNDSFSDDNPILDTHAWNQTAQLKSRVSGPTNLTTSARPWRWLVYANHTNFVTHDKTSLGYTGLFDIGAGLEWQLNVKPLDWFGWQYIAISAGIITSRNVDGFNVGITAR
ncbi:MAG: hypothetical protein IMF17_03465 [Proteobacteria bacterium]|nr:hypothetical protein [Pseudomonadota bacterium]